MLMLPRIKQEAQLSHSNRATLVVIEFEYFAKSLKVTRNDTVVLSRACFKSLLVFH